MTADELRKKYLEFFVSKGHKIIPAAPLVPENDPSVLFTTAGMHPLVPYLMGEKHPEGKRITNVQKCLRTGDIDEVGDLVHHTFFEMLGNWSLGDYFKKEAITWSYEFLTQELKFDPKRLYITCFQGDKDAPKDEESAQVWQDLGVSKERISFLPKSDNWWGPAGETGPCGPDTEMHYDLTQKPCGSNCSPGICECGRFSEIWNNVFMEYNKEKDGSFKPLSQKNVDTGMGLERVLAILNNETDNYKTHLWQPVIKLLENGSNQIYDKNPRPFRIIADHLRAAIFCIVDGVIPSNKQQGYVLRRLIRRSLIQAKKLDIDKDIVKLSQEINAAFSGVMSNQYPELKLNQDNTNEILKQEIQKFQQTLQKGLNQFNKLVKVTPKDAFDLFQSYGFPFELTQELAQEKGQKLDKKDFDQQIKKHQDLSRSTSAGMFKGGLADHSETTTKYHTTTHLLQQALRDVLGDHVQQAGSNITTDRLRFDFTHDKPLTDQQIQEVEDAINSQISADLPVVSTTMPYQDAINSGALAFFKAKYPQQVTVYSIGDYSKEICGGPHVKQTSQIGKIKVGRENSVGAGLRRIYLNLTNANQKNLQE